MLWTARIAIDDSVVNVSALTFSPHIGTHADAPLHYDNAGLPVGLLPLETFIGPCRVIRARGDTQLVEPEHIAHALGALPPRILIRTSDGPQPTRWTPDFRTMAPAAMTLLHRHGARLVGIDAPSVDPADSTDLPSHQVARQHGLTILENLILEAVEPGDYELIALPLKLISAEASPVRAILRPLTNRVRTTQ